MIPRLVNVALGVWLMFAPAVLGYSTSSTVANAVDRTIGPLVVSAAIVSIWPEIRPVRRVNTFLGGVLIVLPLVLTLFVDYPLAGIVDGVVVGLAVVAASLVRGPLDARFGGGWRSVWKPELDTTGQGHDRGALS